MKLSPSELIKYKRNLMIMPIGFLVVLFEAVRQSLVVGVIGYVIFFLMTMLFGTMVMIMGEFALTKEHFPKMSRAMSWAQTIVLLVMLVFWFERWWHAGWSWFLVLVPLVYFAAVRQLAPPLPFRQVRGPEDMV